jgi:predicted nucleotidyltransferase
MNLPKEVKAFLEEYINLVNKYIPSTLEEIYIHGSIALGAYEHKSSDIDLLTVMNRRLTEEDTEALHSIHTILVQTYEKPELDCVYISWEQLSKISSKSKGRNEKYQFYNDGELQFGDYFNFNPITWWTLKNHGIKVIGRDSEVMKLEVSAEDLVSYVHNNMNSYWINFIQRVDKNKEALLDLPSKEIDLQLEWIVLGLLRQFYTIKEQNIISKLGAGNYGISSLSRQWHNIIQEAINIRKGINDRIYSTDRERLESTIRFSQYLIEHCNSIVE